MAMFADAVRRMIDERKIRIRGSLRTKRLRKKRLRHFHDVYVQLRDELMLRRHGMTFAQWREAKRQSARADLLP